MIKLKLNCSKIPKDKLFEGKNGKYIDLVLFDNREPDQYGNDGFISVDTTKEEREAGEKGVIVGNWKHLGSKKSPAESARTNSQGRRPDTPPPRPTADPDLDADPSDDIPFNFEAHALVKNAQLQSK